MPKIGNINKINLERKYATTNLNVAIVKIYTYFTAVSVTKILTGFQYKPAKFKMC